MNKLIFLAIGLLPLFSLAENHNPSQAVILFAPNTGTFQEGATFELPIFINTLGHSVNSVNLHINFDPQKLSITNPGSGKSIVTEWIDPPSYSNLSGDLSLKGTITEGITTRSGLIITVTFKALSPGETRVIIVPDSEVLSHDGEWGVVETAFDTGFYTILPKAQQGIRVFSPTHPFQDQWYNNNAPYFSWEKSPDIDAFSFILDNQPLTIPDNNPEGSDTSISFPDIKEGLSYFHIKARKNNNWGGTTHFLVRIDTTPPAELKTEIKSLLSAVITSRAVVTFAARDLLSGMDHYEVGVVDSKNALDISPVFVEAESPYQIPTAIRGEMAVIVRAFDKAGNSGETVVSVSVFPSLLDFIKGNIVTVALAIVLMAILGIMLVRYLSHRRLKLVLVKDPLPHETTDHYPESRP